jgi:hypothetical protein
MMRLDVVSPDDAAWDGWIERLPHDSYHTSAYHSISRSMGEGDPFLAVCSEHDRVLAWPFLLRDIESRDCPGWKDITSVYGYCGPVALNCDGAEEFLGEASRQLAGLWASWDVVSVFTRFHPILGTQRWAEHLDEAVPIVTPLPGEVPGAALSFCGYTVSIDLTLSDSEATARYDRNTRQEIKRSRLRGLATTIDEDWTTLPGFLRIYYAAMDRNEAADEYYFPCSYFEELKERLGHRAWLAVTRFGSDIAASCVILEENGILQAHLGGAAPDYVRRGAFKVLFDDIRRMGAARGGKALHLGGGRGGQSDSLFHFKAHFSDRRHPYFLGRWVLNPEIYAALCAETERRNGEAAADDFFPAYRKKAQAAPARAVAAAG